MPPKWTSSAIENALLEAAITKFMRLHRNGCSMLMQFMDSMPADRTEREFNNDQFSATDYMKQFSRQLDEALKNGPRE